MRSLSILLRPAAAAGVVLLAACDGDGGGTTPDRLTPDEVAGVYEVCELKFAPANSILPTADLLVSVVDTTPPAGRPQATLALSANRQADLVYTRASDAFLQQFRGTAQYGQQHVTLQVGSSPVGLELLLPRPLNLRYSDANGQRLTAGTADNLQYAVARADYARAARVSEEGLQATINGRLAATLAAGGCD